jgi:hypothetical protein
MPVGTEMLPLIVGALEDKRTPPAEGAEEAEVVEPEAPTEPSDTPAPELADSEPEAARN